MKRGHEVHFNMATDERGQGHISRIIRPPPGGAEPAAMPLAPTGQPLAGAVPLPQGDAALYCCLGAPLLDTPPSLPALRAFARAEIGTQGLSRLAACLHVAADRGDATLVATIIEEAAGCDSSRQQLLGAERAPLQDLPVAVHGMHSTAAAWWAEATPLLRACRR